MSVNSQDALCLVAQFLRENNLDHSLKTLQSETSQSFNTIDNKDAFLQDIRHGRWVSVLKQTNTLSLPTNVLNDLYEMVLVDLVDQNDKQAAMTTLYSPVLQKLRQRDHERYGKLDRLVDGKITSSDIFGPGISSDQQRQKIVGDISQEIKHVPSARLLTLLSQSLLWQQQQGLQLETGYDLFKGTAPIQQTEDTIAATPYVSIKFPGKKTFAECAAFPPHGQFLATGTVDGFIELWNYSTGKLRKDFQYQAEDNLMAMDNAVSCLAFSKDGELLASGSTDGSIAVWKVQTGRCIRRLPKAHSEGISSMCFNKDGTQVLSGGFDHIIRLHGLKSGKILKEFRGHTSFVNTALYSQDGSRIISGSSDGSVKIWDNKTTNCLFTVIPQVENKSSTASAPGGPKTKALNPTGGIGGQAVQQIVPLPNQPDQFLVCNKSNILYIVNLRGQIVKHYAGPALHEGHAQFHHGIAASNDMLAAAVSPHGQYIYGISEFSVLYCFQASNGNLVHETKVSSYEVTGMTSHPLINVLTIHDDHGYVYLLRP
ncbi:WD40 repeat-like protein [Hesseltinella vesiculosa]|uniref:WD40 repeat-like protein n=1 Tax=Hesseltinella vesiculosa TaxID=101127 RepID=A0A1X2GS60_9FUNG|nr:WD40 repeat-like protein [Hesseltinella vesiculosa]